MSRQKTGGGRFDPAEEAVYFIAGNFAAEVEGQQGITVHTHTLMATNDLDARGAIADFENRLTYPNHRLLLDSGIFWLTNRHMRQHPGMTMDYALGMAPADIDGFEPLFNLYLELVQKYEQQLWGYIELDQGGASNKKKTRAQLEGMGLRPIPVYHPLNDGWDYFDELCEGYDRVCVGNVVQANSADRRRLFHTMWERHRKYPDVWLHLLGVTPNEMCTVYPPSSTDSATFCYSLKYGAITTPFASSMNAPFSRLDHRYSYLQGGGMDGPGGIRKGVAFLAAHASFMERNWRRQQADLLDVLEHPVLPPVDEREGVRL